MANPLFVETSEGYINLASVTQIKQYPRGMQFSFIGGSISEVELPLKEGEQIMQRLRSNAPDLFVQEL